jgi:hypothetical protein
VWRSVQRYPIGFFWRSAAVFANAHGTSKTSFAAVVLGYWIRAEINTWGSYGFRSDGTLQDGRKIGGHVLRMRGGEFMGNSIEVNFAHPRNSDLFVAEIEPAVCTGQEAINGLVTAQFVPAAPANRPYELAVARTQAAITPSMTLAQGGVKHGDVIEVRQANIGAAA